MNTEQAAALLNGRKYLEEISREEELQFKDLGLVVVFGASDDLLEFRGAIYDELGAWRGTTAYLVKKKGKWSAISTFEFEKYHEKLEELGLEDALIYHTVTAEWGPQQDGKFMMSWRITTDIPHSTFFILDDDDNYCQGLVFHISSLENKTNG